MNERIKSAGYFVRSERIKNESGIPASEKPIVKRLRPDGKVYTDANSFLESVSRREDRKLNGVRNFPPKQSK